MKVCYFDCGAGAAGDMILAALIDAGAPTEEVRAHLGSLDTPGWSLAVEQVARASLRATKVHVTVEEAGTIHRPYREIERLVRSSPLPERARRWALEAFALLARAEARVHDTTVEDVVFHEAGGLDSLIDVVGSCVALDLLGIDRVITSVIATGTGASSGAHGRIPIPAPAAAEILAERGAPIEVRGEGEALTPTGAAILAAVTDTFGTPPPMELGAIGYGAGTRDTEIPNVVRAMLGDATGVQMPGEDRTLLIETNLDDVNPELLPHVIDELLSAGALDAWLTPITMKKGRPGLTLSVLAQPIHKWHVFEILFRETTTFGVRISSVEREVLDREWVEVEVEGLPVRVKVGRRAEAIVTLSPEYEDARAVARATGLPLKDVYALALRAVETRISD